MKLSSRHRTDYGSDAEQPPGWGGQCVYWVLAALGTATLACCILLPEWRACQSLECELRAKEQQVAHLEHMVADQRRRIELLRDDPAVAVRMARRELGFRLASERVLPVRGMRTMDPVAAGAPLDAVLQSPPLPSPTSSPLLRFVEDRGFEAVFHDPALRSMLVTLSVTLIAAAMVIFRRM